MRSFCFVSFTISSETNKMTFEKPCFTHIFHKVEFFFRLYLFPYFVRLKQKFGPWNACYLNRSQFCHAIVTRIESKIRPVSNDCLRATFNPFDNVSLKRTQKSQLIQFEISFISYLILFNYMY